MFLDASALVAILIGEDDSDLYIARIADTKTPLFVSATAVFETVMGVARARTKSRDPLASHSPTALMTEAQTIVNGFLAQIGAQHIAIDAEIGLIAQEACKTYGVAAGSPAKLNFGDCFAYACAKACNVPLLYKGMDFAKTDLA